MSALCLVLLNDCGRPCNACGDLQCTEAEPDVRQNIQCNPSRKLLIALEWIALAALFTAPVIRVIRELSRRGNAPERRTALKTIFLAIPPTGLAWVYFYIISYRGRLRGLLHGHNGLVSISIRFS